MPGASVTVVAEKFGSDTTSHGAAGVWGPYVSVGWTVRGSVGLCGRGKECPKLIDPTELIMVSGGGGYAKEEA